jgi:hypothetical protein
MKKITLDFKLLIYDIETSHLKARIWKPGEQVVRHGQLLKSTPFTKILTISYKWFHEDVIHTLTCKEDGSNLKKMISEFDKEIRKSDVVLGKNNFNFDDKHLNTNRLLTGGDPIPEWAYKSDDLERQLRKYFTFPSQSLDYVGELLTGQGKMKMEEEDWNNIEDHMELKLSEKTLHKKVTNEFCRFHYGKSRRDIVRKGRESFRKMVTYNQIDILKTEEILNQVLPHILLKYNASTKNKYINPNTCITCGSINVEVKSTIIRGASQRHEFYCRDHNGYAGSRPFVRKPNGHVRYTASMGK